MFFDKVEIKDLCVYLWLIVNVDDDFVFICVVIMLCCGIGNMMLEVFGLFVG